VHFKTPFGVVSAVGVVSVVICGWCGISKRCGIASSLLCLYLVYVRVHARVRACACG